MKTGLLTRSVLGLGVLVFSAASTATAQTPPASPEQLNKLVLEIAEQNRKIEANQKEIDARVAEIEELVRQARIYASRSGRKGVLGK